MSTHPGLTTSPSASTSRAPRPSTFPTSVTRPPSTATSAVRASAPVPSTTVPPRITSSCVVMAPDATPYCLPVSWDGDSYQERFDRLAAAGADVHGEAAFVVSYEPASVLDAGCGTGRVAAE